MIAVGGKRLAAGAMRVHARAMRKIAAAVAITLCLSGVPAGAASSDWYRTEGGSVRLVTERAPGADGVLRGALEIALDPGWKTYWRDPGDAGVPPSLDLSASTGVESLEIDFPAPERHDDGYAVWAGYDAPVSLPIRLKLADPAQSPSISAKVFLGICQSICIPVSTTLDVAAEDGSGANDAAVTAAFAALPEHASERFGIIGVSAAGEALEVRVSIPDDVESAELFLAGADGYAFGLAEPAAVASGAATFTVPVYGRPKAVPTGSGLHYTLVSGDRSVSGTIDYP